MKLSECKPGQNALIKNVGGEGALRQHFLDMGVLPGTGVTVMKYAPMGDPVELRIRGYELTLRLDDAARIDVEPVDTLPETGMGAGAAAAKEAGKTAKKKTGHESFAFRTPEAVYLCPYIFS